MYQVGDVVRLNNGSVVVIIAYGLNSYHVEPLQGDSPVKIFSSSIKCRVKATYEDVPEPKPITALDARILVGRAAVEHGQEVTATKIGDDRYRLSFLGDPDRDGETHYSTDVREAEAYLNSL